MILPDIRSTLEQRKLNYKSLNATKFGYIKASSH